MLICQLADSPEKQSQFQSYTTLNANQLGNNVTRGFFRVLLFNNEHLLGAALLTPTSQSEAELSFFQSELSLIECWPELIALAKKYGLQRIAPAPSIAVQEADFSQLLALDCNEPLSSDYEHWLKSLQDTWRRTIPLSQFMKVKLCHFDGGELIASCDQQNNLNLHNTLFAGSIYTLATLTGWGWVYLQLKQASLEGDIVLADGKIQYKKPVTGQPFASTLSADNNGDISILSLNEKARFDVQVNILNGDTIAATFKGQYVILPKSTT